MLEFLVVIQYQNMLFILALHLFSIYLIIQLHQFSFTPKIIISELNNK